ncbi:MAG TPA: hypothetical protein PK747_06130 [Acidobacteriota bacterium]|nr:hypothetical protein [Acidobacteriota bacterium]HQO19926.1 hypothetical protein [Acidobacteriota bacterium]HQQ46973.1 hypothetical protein [Acidobacteriota bacterium]
MKIIMIVLSGVFSVVQCFSQTLDVLSTCVVFLEQKNIETRKIDNIDCEMFYRKPGEKDYKPLYESISGSGFFLADGKILYLATAKHVALALKPDANVMLRMDNDRPLTLPLSHLTGGVKKYKWYMSEKADVAILPLDPPPDAIPYLQRHFVSTEQIEIELKSPERELTLIVVGFPLRIGIGEYFSPVSKEAKAASGLQTIGKQTIFLLDSPSAEGFSGGPVFISTGFQAIDSGIRIGGKSICVGIVTATISDNTGGKFAAVVPSYYLHELISQVNSNRVP